MLYGGSLSLEFITLIVLRIREPHLKREFKVPGGLAGAVTLGIFPLALLALAMVESEHESILGMNGLLFGVIIIATGILGYAATKKFRHPGIKPSLYSVPIHRRLGPHRNSEKSGATATLAQNPRSISPAKHRVCAAPRHSRCPRV